jgi:hypothetical protein
MAKSTPKALLTTRGVALHELMEIPIKKWR